MGEQPEHGLTHFAEDGRSRMVDVTDKAVTKRTARASGQVQMAASTLAGIMAAKRTSDLIPLCHPLPISSIDIQFQLLNDSTLSIEATVTVSGKTGVEMEALSAVTIAALTVYDMCKSVEKGMVIGPIRLEEKDGGRSGHFVRQ